MGPIIWEEGVPNTSPSMVVHHSIMFPARLFLHQRMVITDAQWEVFHLGFTASSEAEVWWWVERGVLAHSAKFKLSKYWCLTWNTVRASLGVVMVTWRWQPLAWLTHLLKDEMSTLGMAHKWTLRQEEGQGIVEPAVFALRYLQGLKNFH